MNPKGLKTPLSDKAAAFVLEYVKDFNGARAARAAGYSAKSAKRLAVKLLDNPKIQLLLQEFQKERKREAVLTFDERARILSEIGRATMADFVEVHPGGTVGLKVSAEHTQKASLQELTQEVKSEDQGGGLVTKLKLRDPVQAIRELNEMFGDHAPKRFEGKLTGSIDAMGEDEVDAAIRKLESEEAEIASGKGKAGRQGKN